MLYAAAFITCWASISGVVAILKCYTNVPQLKVVDPFHMKVIILLLDYFVKNYKSSRLPDRISKLRKDLAILLLSLDGKWICNYTFGWLLTNSAAVRCKKRVPCILPTQFCKASDGSDGISLKFWMIDVFSRFCFISAACTRCTCPRKKSQSSIINGFCLSNENDKYKTPTNSSFS